ncbi:MAG TPA: glycosyltransferase family 2 protein [Methanospirillum sp.]|nr:glycosyltransferase family 2 protein [Methanospirillum sp.]
MTDLPIVSIITPSYNQGRFIERTILSVLTQDYPNIEYFVLDGGSTDQTISILEKYRDHLMYISEPDTGQTDAINKGIRFSTGEILAYLNSDDTYPPGAVSAAVNYLINVNPDSVFVYGEGNNIDTQDVVIRRYPTEPYSLENLIRTCIICQPTTFWKRKVIDEVGYFNERLHYCMDYEYWIRVALKYGHLDYLPVHLGNYREYSETKSLSNRIVVHQENFVMLQETIGEIPLPWVYSYARAIIERQILRDKSFFAEILYIIGVCMIFPFLLLRYHLRVTVDEVRWVVSKMKVVISDGCTHVS